MSTQLTGATVIPREIPEPIQVVAICMAQGHPRVTGAQECHCGGTVRRLVQPIRLEYYQRLRESGEWQDLKTVRVK